MGDDNRPPDESPSVADAMLRESGSFLKDLLTGPALVVAGIAVVALGYLVGFAPIGWVGMIVILIGLGSMFVW